MPERMGRDFAELVASEFESALARDPKLDLRAYAERSASRSCIGRRRSSFPTARRSRPKAPKCRAACDSRAVPPPRCGGGRERGPGGPGDRPGDRALVRRLAIAGFGGPPPTVARRPAAWPRMFGPPRRGPVMAPIQHNDAVVAVVWVPPLTGLRRFAETIGTPLALGVLLLLIAGTAVAALVIFRPAQARLRALEDAARRFGEGDLTARAPAIGGDEVAAVADAFNRMADRSRGAPGAAGRSRSRAPPAARRRVARADDAAHRDSRLRRNAGAAAVRPDDRRKGSARSR